MNCTGLSKSQGPAMKKQIGRISPIGPIRPMKVNYFACWKAPKPRNAA